MKTNSNWKFCSVQVIHLNKTLNKYFLWAFVKAPFLFWTDQLNQDSNLLNEIKKEVFATV